jgi:hypothetical protein
MKSRGDISAVIEGLHREHGLLAAFLEATDKIVWRPLHRQEPIVETAMPVNLEASLEAVPASEAPKAPVAPFAFRRANLVRASE